MNKLPPIPDRIEWHEGMLLAPQHFQQLSARLDSLVAWQTLAAAPFSWGVRQLTLDQGLLPTGLLRVLSLDAVLPDGTAVQYDASRPDDGPLELSIVPHAPQMALEPLTVYLTLPVQLPARHRSAATRYRSCVTATLEDEVSDAEPIALSVLRPNLALEAGAVPPSTHVHLPLVRIARENEVYRLHETLPPLLEVPRQSGLWQATSALLGQIRSKAAFIAKQTSAPASRVEDRLTQLELRERLRSLLTGLPQAEAILHTPHLHPLPLYWALCQLDASLSLLRPGGMPAVPQDYDHANPSAIFTPLLRHLQEAVSDVSQEYVEHKFEFRLGAFEIVLQPAWTQGQRLVVGLRGTSDRDLLAWMGSAIIGTESSFASLRERRVLGAARERIDSAAELGVKPGSGHLLFAIPASAGVAVPGERLLIANANEGVLTQRPQEIVLFTKE